MKNIFKFKKNIVTWFVIISVVLISLLSGILLYLKVKSTTSAWKSYKNDKYGFSVSYPLGYYISPDYEPSPETRPVILITNGQVRVVVGHSVATDMNEGTIKSCASTEKTFNEDLALKIKSSGTTPEVVTTKVEGKTVRGLKTASSELNYSVIFPMCINNKYFVINFLTSEKFVDPNLIDKFASKIVLK